MLHGVTKEMCVINYDDRMDCVLDPMVTREECTKRDCCFDNSVPDGIPHCYFAFENLSELTVAENTNAQQETCEINPYSMVGCGRKGVPRNRCLEIGCCWNKKWRLGGTSKEFFFLVLVKQTYF